MSFQSRISIPALLNSENSILSPIDYYQGNSQSNTLQQQPNKTSSTRRKTIKLTATMEQELVRIAKENIHNSRISWEKVLKEFTKTFPNPDLTAQNLSFKYYRLIKKVESSPSLEASSQQTTGSTDTGNTAIESAKGKTNAIYSEEMENKLVSLAATTTKANRKPDWDKITELFHTYYPESSASADALKTKYRRINQAKINPKPQPTSISSLQCEISATSTTTTASTQDVQSNMLPITPSANAEAHSVISINVNYGKESNVHYTEEMIKILKELACTKFKANGRRDWNTITTIFNERFPHLIHNKRSLQLKYSNEKKAEKVDQTLGVRHKAKKLKKHRTFSKEMEKDLLHLGQEQLDQNKEIDWQQTAKIMNSKYMIHRSENSYKSTFEQLYNSELTASDIE